MAEDELVSVFETTDVGHAEIVRMALEAEGIPCSLENEHQAAMSGILNCRLLVKAVDEVQARNFIQDHEQNRG